MREEGYFRDSPVKFAAPLNELVPVVDRAPAKVVGE